MNVRAAPRVAVVDAGGSNIGSVCHALERLGIAAVIARDADELVDAERIVLPGVGAAAPAMALLCARGFDVALHDCSVPVLGICLGMQLLYEASEEGDVACLGVLIGRVQRMQPASGLRLPHMGWNALQRVSADSPLFDGIDDGAEAYFVHGYAVPVGESTVATATHGATFAAVVQQGKYCGVQFHPERSAAVGARLLDNFLQWRP